MLKKIKKIDKIAEIIEILAKNACCKALFKKLTFKLLPLFLSNVLTYTYNAYYIINMALQSITKRKLRWQDKVKFCLYVQCDYERTFLQITLSRKNPPQEGSTYQKLFIEYTICANTFLCLYHLSIII